MTVIMFGIEIDIVKFIVWLSVDKIEKAIKATTKALSQKTVSFIGI